MTVSPVSGEGPPLHVAIVSQYFWPEDFRINELAVGLKERGHQVTVLTGLPNYPSGSFFKGYSWFGPWREQYKNVDVIRAPLIPRGIKSKIGLAMNYLSFAVFASLLAPFRMREKYDVVFAYEPSPITVGFPAIVTGKLSKAPVFFWTLDIWPESVAATGLVKSKAAIGFARLLGRFVYRNCNVVLSPSRGFIAPIRATAGKVIDVRYFPQWGEKPASDPVPTYNDMPKLPEGFSVMFTGNVGVSQDFETILDAAALLRDQSNIHWLIVGDGHHLDAVKRQVVDKNLSATVHCFGRHPSSAMTAFFAQADVLLATLRDEPAFAMTVPAKIQSYLSSAKPIITAINGDVALLIKESGAGIAVPAGDAEALAAAVKRMAALPQAERDAMGLRGKVYFDANFSQDLLFDQLVTWFREAKLTGKQTTLTQTHTARDTK